MENFKRSVKRLITRLTVLGLVVICGAIAIAQANKERVVAHAAAPDLAEPGATLNDVGNSAVRAFNAVAVAEEPRDWGGASAAREQPAQTNSAADFIHDAAVATVQAVEEVPNRFGNSFSNEPDSDLQPAPTESAANQFAAPDFMSEDDTLPPENAPLPPADTSLPEFPVDAGNVIAHDNSQYADPHSNVAPIEPPPATEDFAPPRFGAQAAPAANPVRPGSAAEFTRNAAPAPSFESTPPPTNTPTRNVPDQRFAEPQTYSDVRRNDFATSRDTRNDFGPPDYSNQSDVDAGDFRNNSNNAMNVSGAGKPGPRELEGMQSPTLSVQKIAPKNVRVGEPATFIVKVRNNGQVPAERVHIRDEIPLGTQLVDTNPQATTDSTGAVLWQIGTLRPGQDVTVSMQVTPSQEGQIGSVATVVFETKASAQAEVKQPMLKIEHSTAGPVLVGERVNFAITLENPGSGPAENVVIEEDVPPGLSHSKGPRLEYEVGTIPPGGRRRLELSLTAAEAGMVENVIVARGENGLVAEHRINFEVVSPMLQVKIDGPARRYLERPATYTVAIENPGTAPATNVELVTRLPQGLKFVSTNNSGRYDASTNTIRWSLDQLPAREFGVVQFTAIPMQKGDYSINAEATGGKGLRDATDHALVVEGIAALLFQVADQYDPIAVGGVTSYQISVRNQGTKEASNVRFVALVPPGMRAVAAQGDTRYQIQGNQVMFETIERLPAKSETVYNVQIEGVQAGDQRFTVQMTSDDTNTPVVKEESTRVVAD